jgi:hypothetical protein
MIWRFCISTGRQEAIFTGKRKRGLLIHLFVYVAVNGLLIVVNLLYTPHYYWFLFPLIGWACCSPHTPTSHSLAGAEKLDRPAPPTGAET